MKGGGGGGGYKVYSAYRPVAVAMCDGEYCGSVLMTCPLHYV